MRGLLIISLLGAAATPAFDEDTFENLAASPFDGPAALDVREELHIPPPDPGRPRHAPQQDRAELRDAPEELEQVPRPAGLDERGAAIVLASAQQARRGGLAGPCHTDDLERSRREGARPRHIRSVARQDSSEVVGPARYERRGPAAI